MFRFHPRCFLGNITGTRCFLFTLLTRGVECKSVDQAYNDTGETVARGPALRARLGPTLLQTVRDRYGLGDGLAAIDLGGSSNLNLLVTGAAGRYVVRVYRPWITPDRLAAIQLVRRTLHSGGVPTPETVFALDGSGWIVVDDRLVEVERYGEHDGNMDSWERIEAGLPWLGRIHTLLQPVDVSPDGKRPAASNNVEPLIAAAWTRRGTQRIRGWNSSPEDLRLADASEELADLVNAAERELIPQLPRQLVHGDFWDNNVLFRHGKVELITDLDFMGERARIDDLALTLYYTNSKYSEGRDSPERIGRLRILVDAYDSGLDHHPLCAVERAALPLALARAPLCFIGMIAFVDTEQGGRDLAAEMRLDVEWALAIARHCERWQDGFA